MKQLHNQSNYCVSGGDHSIVFLELSPENESKKSWTRAWNWHLQSDVLPNSHKGEWLGHFFYLPLKGKDSQKSKTDITKSSWLDKTWLKNMHTTEIAHWLISSCVLINQLNVKSSTSRALCKNIWQETDDPGTAGLLLFFIVTWQRLHKLETTHITEWTDGMKPKDSGSAHNVSVQTVMLSLEKHGQHVHKTQVQLKRYITQRNLVSRAAHSWTKRISGSKNKWSLPRFLSGRRVDIKRVGRSCRHLATCDQTERRTQGVLAPLSLEAQSKMSRNPLNQKPWNLTPLLPFASESLTDVSGLEKSCWSD